MTSVCMHQGPDRALAVVGIRHMRSEGAIDALGGPRQPHKDCHAQKRKRRVPTSHIQSSGNRKSRFTHFLIPQEDDPAPGPGIENGVGAGSWCNSSFRARHLDTKTLRWILTRFC